MEGWRKEDWKEAAHSRKKPKRLAAAATATSAEDDAPKKRGRKPMPRDENGNIIRN